MRFCLREFFLVFCCFACAFAWYVDRSRKQRIITELVEERSSLRVSLNQSQFVIDVLKGRLRENAFSTRELKEWQNDLLNDTFSTQELKEMLNDLLNSSELPKTSEDVPALGAAHPDGDG